MRPLVLFAGLGLAVACGGGANLPVPAAPLTRPLAWCTGAEPDACHSTREIESWLTSPELEILGAARTSEGIQGARVLTLSVPSRGRTVVFRAKWRAQSTLAVLNDPRHELAAYRLQRLFLRPDEYVVPPAHGRCLDLAQYRARVDGRARATFAGTDCVFGVLSYWIEDARTPADVCDPELYRENAAYRRSVSNLNLLTFLIGHGDSHAGQFLKVERRDGPRVYAVDNSLSFGAFYNGDIGSALDFAQLQVPALPRSSVLRLALASPGELRASAVIEEYEIRDRMLVPVAPEPGVLPRHAGTYWAGRRLIVALTRFELDLVERKLAELAELVDRRELELF